MPKEIPELIANRNHDVGKKKKKIVTKEAMVGRGGGSWNRDWKNKTKQKTLSISFQTEVNKNLKTKNHIKNK